VSACDITKCSPTLSTLLIHMIVSLSLLAPLFLCWPLFNYHLPLSLLVMRTPYLSPGQVHVHIFPPRPPFADLPHVSGSQGECPARTFAYLESFFFASSIFPLLLTNKPMSCLLFRLPGLVCPFLRMPQYVLLRVPPPSLSFSSPLSLATLFCKVLFLRIRFFSIVHNTRRSAHVLGRLVFLLLYIWTFVLSLLYLCFCIFQRLIQVGRHRFRTRVAHELAYVVRPIRSS
jgi:hypothetical protein